MGTQKNNYFFELKENDIIHIRRTNDQLFSGRISISGEVKFPGNYDITKTNEKVSDIISRAGGLTQFAYPMSSMLIRNDKIVKLSFERLIKFPSS